MSDGSSAPCSVPGAPVAGFLGHNLLSATSLWPGKPLHECLASRRCTLIRIAKLEILTCVLSHASCMNACEITHARMMLDIDIAHMNAIALSHKSRAQCVFVDKASTPTTLYRP